MYEEPHRWDDFSAPPPKLPAEPAGTEPARREPDRKALPQPRDVEDPAPQPDIVEGSVVEEPAPASDPSSAPAVDPRFTAEQQRDKRSLQEVMHCEERETVLRTLAAAGRITVTALAARLDMSQKKLSRHLHDLRVAGLIDRQPEGKFAWYEVIPDRVQLLRQSGGLFLLKVRRGNVSITFATEAPVSDTKGAG